MSSGENNLNPHSNLPDLSNFSLKKLGNLMQLSSEVLKEKDPEYWFNKAIENKNSLLWTGVIFNSNRALLLDNKHTASYLIRAFANAQSNKYQECALDVVKFFTEKYVFNRFNKVEQTISTEEWNSLYNFLSEANSEKNETVFLAVLIAKYHSGYRVVIYEEDEIILQTFTEQYVKWELLIGGLLHDFINQNGTFSCIEYFDSAIEKDIDFSAAYFERAYHCSRWRDPKEIANDFKKLIQLETNQKQPLLLLAANWLYNKDNDYSLSFIIEFASNAIMDNTLLSKEAKNDIEFLMVNLWWDANPKQWINAHNTLGNLGLDISLLLRGIMKAKMGDTADAFLDLNKAIELEPNSQNYFERGQIKSQTGDYQGAIEDFTMAITLEQTNKDYYLFPRAETKKIIKDYAGALVDIYAAIDISAETAYEELRDELERMNLPNLSEENSFE